MLRNCRDISLARFSHLQNLYIISGCSRIVDVKIWMDLLKGLRSYGEGVIFTDGHNNAFLLSRHQLHTTAWQGMRRGTAEYSACERGNVVGLSLAINRG